MLDDDRIVALIPARGGSKSVPRKNIRDVGGKPLIGWSIEAAMSTDVIDRTFVSTDDSEIADVASEFGAEIIHRPEHLATDEALVIETVRHTVEWLQDAGESARYMAMLEPTCPFRNADDIRTALELLAENGFDSVATFTEASLNPHRAWVINENRPQPVIEGADPWQPRQRLPSAYELNGGVYAFEIASLPDDGAAMLFGDYGAVTMPPERSIDIDSPLDLQVANIVAGEMID